MLLLILILIALLPDLVHGPEGPLPVLPEGGLEAIIENTRIIARNHYSQIPHMKVLYPGVKSTQNGPSWAIMGYF